MRWHYLVTVAVTTSACSLDLQVPEQVAVVCTRDADCVTGHCAPTGYCADELSASLLALRAASARSDTEVELIFDQPVLANVAGEVARYRIAPSLEVVDAFTTSTTTVLLRTRTQTLGTAYQVIVEGLVSVGGTFLDPNATQATFIGFGIPADTTPPDPLSPSDDDLVVGLAQTFVWTPRAGASDYTVVVARDDACLDVVAQQTVPSATNSVDFTLPGPGVYTWCVSSNVTTAGARGMAAFHVTDDAVYVHCGSVPCSSTFGEHGSPDAPMRSVQRAVSLAQQRGLHTVRIAARNGDAYEELVQITGQSVDLEGGWNATFTSRDPAINVTRMRFASSALIISSIADPLRLSGLDLESDTTFDATTIIVSSANASVTIAQSSLRGAGVGNAKALDVDSASEVVLDHCQVTTAPATNTTGVTAGEGSRVRIVDSTILVGNAVIASAGVVSRGELEVTRSIVMSGDGDPSAGSSTGVNAEQRAEVRDSLIVARNSGGAIALALNGGVVERSRVYANASMPGGVGTGIGARGFPLLLRDNVVVTSGTTGYGVSLYTVAPTCAEGAQVQVVGNTISGSVGALVLRRGSPVIVNNLLRGATCFLELTTTTNDTVDPSSFQNNAMTICTLLYYEAAGAPGEPASSAVAHYGIDEVNLLDGKPCMEEVSTLVRFGNNVAGAQADAEVYTDRDGVDNQLFEIGDASHLETQDNDLSLKLLTDPIGIAAGGKDATASTCGTGSMACGGEAVDVRGMPRTIPWSIGAYEKN